jgi:hypothetical protein
MVDEHPHFNFAPLILAISEQSELEWGLKGTADAYAFSPSLHFRASFYLPYPKSAQTRPITSAFQKPDDLSNETIFCEHLTLGPAFTLSGPHGVHP